MNGAFLMYKCRLCGQTFDAGHAPDAEQALKVARGVAPWPAGWCGFKPTMTVEHECPDRSGIGLADLVGAAPDGGDLP